jgi:hypothetical protein
MGALKAMLKSRAMFVLQRSITGLLPDERVVTRRKLAA